MKWTRKAAKDPVWFLITSLVTLPFKIIFHLVHAVLSSGTRRKDGYILKKSDEGHFQYEHRQIAERILGRRLDHWEVVHHINGRPDDNRPSNLCVMTREDHDRYHAWYDWIYTTYRRYPRRETQLKKLRGTFRGQVLSEQYDKRTGA